MVDCGRLLLADGMSSLGLLSGVWLNHEALEWSDAMVDEVRGLRWLVPDVRW